MNKERKENFNQVCVWPGTGVSITVDRYYFK